MPRVLAAVFYVDESAPMAAGLQVELDGRPPAVRADVDPGTWVKLMQQIASTANVDLDGVIDVSAIVDRLQQASSEAAKTKREADAARQAWQSATN